MLLNLAKPWTKFEFTDVRDGTLNLYIFALVGGTFSINFKGIKMTTFELGSSILYFYVITHLLNDTECLN